MEICEKTDATTETQAAISPLWRNRIFLRDGSSLWGYHTFVSEADARNAIPKAERLLAEWLLLSPTFRIVRKIDGKHAYYIKDYAYSVPMPWGDAP